MDTSTHRSNNQASLDLQSVVLAVNDPSHSIGFLLAESFDIELASDRWKRQSGGTQTGAIYAELRVDLASHSEESARRSMHEVWRLVVD